MISRSSLLAAALVICGVQAASSWMLRRDPYLPSPPKLDTLPAQLAGWSQVSEQNLEPAALDMLSPDDYLARIYQSSASQRQAEVFVAYYKTQLRGKNAHDPKVCLPGAGWNPVDSHITEIPVPGKHASFPAIYYLIKKDDAEQIVLYWFQTPRAVYTFEQQLRLHRILDAIRDNRTDMALVRVMVPVNSQNLKPAVSSAIELAGAAYTSMLPYFPPKSGS